MFEASHQCDDRLRETLRKKLPADLSPTFAPNVEQLINEAGDKLRADLFTLFSNEIGAALKLDLEPNAINRA